METDEAVRQMAAVERRYADLIRQAGSEAERQRLEAQRARAIAAIQRELSTEQVERAHRWMQ